MEFKKAKKQCKGIVAGVVHMGKIMVVYLYIWNQKSDTLEMDIYLIRPEIKSKYSVRYAATPSSSKFNNFVTVSHRCLKFRIWRGCWKSLLDLCIKSKFEQV